MKILMAEDDFASRKFMANYLGKYGECDITVDGEEAVDAFLMALEDEEPYDLICLDVMMPVLDGYGAARAIRALPEKELNTLPIVAMTANAFEEDKRKALEAGMNGHLGKPIEIDKLMETLKSILM